MASGADILAFKRTFKNYGLPDILPVAKGYIYDNLLVIRRCPLCGLSHDHGVPRNGHIGYLTIRTNHCSGRAELESEYVIKIVGNIDKAQYDKTNKLNEIKLNKETFQGIHPKIPSSIEYIKSSDFIAICEDRNSWY